MNNIKFWTLELLGSGVKDSAAMGLCDSGAMCLCDPGNMGLQNFYINQVHVMGYGGGLKHKQIKLHFLSSVFR